METITSQTQELINQRVAKLHHKLREINLSAQIEDLVIKSPEEFMMLAEFRKMKLAKRMKKAQSFITIPAESEARKGPSNS